MDDVSRRAYIISGANTMKPLKMRCKQGHEWEEKDPLTFRFSQGSWACTLPLCQRCIAALLEQFVLAEEVPDDEDAE